MRRRRRAIELRERQLLTLRGGSVKIRHLPGLRKLAAF
jgi:hypothetical protein